MWYGYEQRFENKQNKNTKITSENAFNFLGKQIHANFYYSKFIRITEVKNLTKKYGEDLEKTETPYCWWGLKLVPLLWQYVWRILKKVKKKIDLPHDPAMPLLGIWSKTGHSTPQTHAITVLFTIVRTVICLNSTEAWMTKTWVFITILLSGKEKWTNLIYR